MKARLLLALPFLLLPAAASAQDAYRACLASLRPAAVKAGVPAASFDRITAGLTPDMSVLDFLKAQPEFKIPIWDYMAGLVDAERVAEGRAMMTKWADVLARLEKRTGVPARVIVAVWGVESNYGQSFGKRPLLQSLSTLSCFGRRQEFFRGEFIATLKIIHRGDVDPDHLVGSWAGAFGHTQFMPSTFLRLAVDGDGDGRRDVVDSVPDALASTANFLVKAGWKGSSWGFEVMLPASFPTDLAGRRKKRPMAEWASMGVRRVDGSALPKVDQRVGIIIPAGHDGPAFAVTRNFDAIYSYNAAESYALAIAHLADRLGGAGPFVTPWPTDDPGLSRAEARELQALLTARGYDVGTPNGVIGPKTRAAITDVEARLGWPPSGRAGQKLLAALRAGG